MNILQLLTRAIIALLVGATTVTAIAQVDTQAVGEQHFVAGVAHLNDPSGPKYEEAYREFHASYEKLGLRYVALKIGYCAMFLERDAEAIEMYQLYLSNADNNASKSERARLERDLNTLRTGLVRVSLRLNTVGATLVDERLPAKGPAITNRYPIEGNTMELGIHPGFHRFTVDAAGFTAKTWDFTAEPGSSHSHDFVLESNPPEKPAPAAPPAAPVPAPVASPSKESPAQPRGMSPYVYVGAAATGVFVVAATVTGVLAISKKNEYDDVNKSGLRPGEAQSLQDDAKRLGLFTDIGIGAAVLAAGVTTYLYFAEPRRASAPPVKEAIRWSPSLSANGYSMAISGQF